MKVICNCSDISCKIFEQTKLKENSSLRCPHIIPHEPIKSCSWADCTNDNLDTICWRSTKPGREDMCVHCIPVDDKENS